MELLLLLLALVVFGLSRMFEPALLLTPKSKDKWLTWLEEVDADPERMPSTKYCKVTRLPK
jgi:hypothetical protein